MKFVLNLLVLTFIIFSSSSKAAFIPNSEITASTTLPTYVDTIFGSFPIEEILDGITSDAAPYNGFAAAGVTTGVINFNLNSDYDITAFSLWNDINVLNEGVRSFDMMFYDSSGVLLGSLLGQSAISTTSAQEYMLTAILSGVRSISMNVTFSNLQIEIREIAFSGQLSYVSTPWTAPFVILMIALLMFRKKFAKFSRNDS